MGDIIEAGAFTRLDLAIFIFHTSTEKNLRDGLADKSMISTLVNQIDHQAVHYRAKTSFRVAT